jgi:hypothetical protein
MVRRSALMAALLGSCSAFALADPRAAASLYERGALSGGNCRAQDAAELRDLSRLFEPLRVSLRSHEVPLAVRNELLDVLSAGREPARR